MVSIKDIAKECNVSVATVSKALNDQSDISDATKEKVKKAAKKLGYMTNVSARALKTNRTYNLGILFADERAGLGHEYFSKILESFQREAERFGYDITFINHAIAGKKTTYLKHVEYRNLDGIVIMTADFEDPEILELAQSGHPVVAVDYVLDGCAAVLSDNSRGLDEIVHYLHRMGHRKIAFIHGDPTFVTQERIGSFRGACIRLGIDIPENYVLAGHYHDIEDCRIKTAQLLELPDPPTAIIFPDDYSYIGGMEEITSRGLNIPNDISAVGYDGINMAKIMGLTTYEQNTQELGQLAVRKLLQLINEPELPPERVIVSGRMLEGKSVNQVKE
ncbi:MAG: LacI family DNA-binding transcriptional regulator [Erysipelotrichaceae bacterium]|nr:LacI family DNA-binding transcriptional regulator [Erysipelotrichaceae bacterium]MBQ6560699.1 LacI family DNA-binding transcriptional regulator [Erysipelotrichaceae bacterium]